MRKRLATLTPTLSNKMKGSITLTLTLSPQGRGHLKGNFPRRERKIREWVYHRERKTQRIGSFWTLNIILSSYTPEPTRFSMSNPIFSKT